MSQTSIAKAALVLTTDSTSARTGLNQFGTEVKQWAGRQKAEVGNAIGGAFKGAFIGGAIGASLTTAFNEVLSKVGDWVSGIGKLKEALHATEQSIARQVKLTDAAAASSKEWRDAAVDRPSKARSLDAEIERYRELERSLTKEGADSNAALMKLREKNLDNFVTFATRRLGEADEVAWQRASKAWGAVDATREKIAALVKERDRLNDPITNPKTWETYGRALQEQTDRLRTFGMTSTEKLIDSLSQQGLSEGMLAKVRHTADQADLAEHRAKNLPAASMAGWLGPALAAAGQVVEKLQAAKPNFDNAALLRGSSAEVTARLRHDVGGTANQQLAEQRRANRHLEQIDHGIKNLTEQQLRSKHPAPIEGM